MDKDIKYEKLIDRFLQNKLNTEEKENFRQLYLGDPEFKVELKFRMALNIALLQTDEDALDKDLDYIIDEIEEKTNKRKSTRIIAISTAFASLAAILIIAFVVFNPVQKIKINNYVSQVNQSVNLPLGMLDPSMRSIINGDSTEIIDTRLVKCVNNKKLEGHYFIRNRILFIYSDGDVVNLKLFRSIDRNGWATYYLCTKEGLFLFDYSKEDKIRELIVVTDTDLLDLCK